MWPGNSPYFKVFLSCVRVPIGLYFYRAYPKPTCGSMNDTSLHVAKIKLCLTSLAILEDNDDGGEHNVRDVSPPITQSTPNLLLGAISQRQQNGI